MPCVTILASEMTPEYRERRAAELAASETRVRLAAGARGKQLAFRLVRPGELFELLEGSAFDKEQRAGDEHQVLVYECAPPLGRPGSLLSTWRASDLLGEERPPQLNRRHGIEIVHPLARDWARVREWLEEELRAQGAVSPRGRLSALAAAI